MIARKTKGIRAANAKRERIPPAGALSPAEHALLALLAYAAHDEEFRATLALIGSSLPFPHAPIAPYRIGGKIGLIVPPDRETAERRAAWLAAGIREGWLPGASAAGRLLAAWSTARTEERPKMVVIGHILGIIPPVGVGNIKRKRKLTLIAKEDLAGKNPAALALASARLSAEVIARAAQRSGGRMERLEPETAEWLFGERLVALFAADARTIGTIARDARELGAIHAKEEDSGGNIAVLALSPMTNGEYLDLHYDLRALEGEDEPA